MILKSNLQRIAKYIKKFFFWFYQCVYTYNWCNHCHQIFHIFQSNLLLFYPNYYLVYIFLAVIGAYCELSAVNELKEIGVTLLLFTCLAVMLHGVFLIVIGGLIYRDWEMIAIVSQANIGGGTTAIALAETFNRKDLILPAILVGTLGNALGTYLGFFVIYIL